MSIHSPVKRGNKTNLFRFCAAEEGRVADEPCQPGAVGVDFPQPVVTGISVHIIDQEQ